WPNQFVNVHLLLETEKNAVVIPSAALQRGPDGNYVFVVKPDKTVEVRPVTVAISQANLAQIASGLSPNETVVTDGQDKLQAGSRIEPHIQGPGTRAAGQNATRNPASGGANPPNNRGPGNPQTGSPATGTRNQGTASP